MSIIADLLEAVTHDKERLHLYDENLAARGKIRQLATQVEYLQGQLETREELFQQYAEAKTALAQAQHFILELVNEQREPVDPGMRGPLEGKWSPPQDYGSQPCSDT